MVKKYIEAFTIDAIDTEIMNDLANRDFALAEIKRKYNKNRIDRLMKAFRELDILEEVGKKENKIGRNMIVYRLNFGKEKMEGSLFYTGEKKMFFKVNDGAF